MLSAKVKDIADIFAGSAALIREKMKPRYLGGYLPNYGRRTALKNCWLELLVPGLLAK
jgi:hypothetical protein